MKENKSMDNLNNVYDVNVGGGGVHYYSKTPRESGIELYRILMMLAIVAHHYVVNSPLANFVYSNYSKNFNSIFLGIFGAWGKVAINGFVIITGYFMCKSKIDVVKFIRLFAEVVFYNLVCYFFFINLGFDTFRIKHFVRLFIVVSDLDKGFTSCFLAFYLLIPFLNILVANMTKKQHATLICLLFFFYTILSTKFNILYNYVTWFCVLFFYGSYIRFYPNKYFSSAKWTGLSFFLSLILGAVSFPFFGYRWLMDCQKILAVASGVTGFLFFKNLKIKYNPIINKIAASTFGVLCIHANSDEMRAWLWGRFANAGVYEYSSFDLVLYSFTVVAGVFIVCTIIDWIRIATVEKWGMKILARFANEDRQ